MSASSADPPAPGSRPVRANSVMALVSLPGGSAASPGRASKSAARTQTSDESKQLPVETVFSSAASSSLQSAKAADLGRGSDSKALDEYRQARAYFEAGKHTNAILAFDRFLENHPDHALAGNARYLTGESYYREGDFKLALEEYREAAHAARGAFSQCQRRPQ